MNDTRNLNRRNFGLKAREFAKPKIKLPFWEFGLLLLFSAYYLLPIVSSTVNFMVLLGLGVFYLAVVAVFDPKWMAPIAIFLGCAAFISILYFTLTDTATISATASNYGVKRIASKLYQYFMMFFPACIFVRLYTKGSVKQRKWFLFIAVIMFSVVLINTYVELIVNPSASKTWVDVQTQNQNNIGTYAFVYAVPEVIVALVSLLYTLRGVIKKLIVFGCIMFMFSFLAMSQFTLALLAAIIGSTLQVSANMKSGTGKALLWVAISAGLLASPFILNFLADIIESEQMSLRLKELSAFFGQGDATGYNLNGRFELYKKSILAFLQSPILGNRRLSFDGHATLFIVPADIGIFGAIALFFLLFKSKDYVASYMGGEKKHFIPIFVCIMIMGFTNPIHSAVTALYSTWLLAPMLLHLGRKDKQIRQ